MRLYYYLLFRIHQFYIKRPKEQSLILFNITGISTIIVFLNIFSVYLLLYYLDFVPMLINKYLIVLGMFILGVLNYIYMIKPKKFLEHGFTEDRKGGFSILLYLIVTIVFFIVVANCNRAKIFKERKNSPSIEKINNKEPASLEGRIRKWFED